MHFKVAVRIFHALFMKAGDSLTDVLRVVSVLIDKLGAASQVALCN